MKRSILITAGGTGGHVFPALAVAKLLKQRTHNVFWVGTKTGIENILVPKNNIEFSPIKISGLRKKGLFKLLIMPFLLCYAILQSMGIILHKRPDVIVGFGGYVTFPVLFAGWVLRVPLVLHEQNSVVGLSNKILSKLVNQVCVAFAGVLPSKTTLVVGNPVREDILNIPSPDVRYKNLSGGLHILIVGGSLGAKALNDVLPLILTKVTNIAQITHQVGRVGLDEVQQKYNTLLAERINAGLPTITVKVVSFIDDMAAEYLTADLIICRSGALTVSEVCSVGIAALFVPFPHAVDDHQWHNAKPLADLGGAKIIRQAELTLDKLVNVINHLTREDCQNMANIARTLAIPDSAPRICDAIAGVLK